MRPYLLFILILVSGCQIKDPLTQGYLPIEMVVIPSGSFLLGSDKGYLANETPRVTIHLNTFQISHTEITQQQYAEVMNEWPSYNVCGTCPVEQVSWLDAVKFCNALSEKENLTPAYEIYPDTVIWNRYANGYRLPTEPEWEYACKAGTDTDLFTGNLRDLHLNLLTAELDSAGWFSGNSNTTQPVGKKKPNALGVYDMHGNVWEWCWDYYNPDRYLFMENPSTNPADEKYNNERIIRGGSFYNDVFNARSALRYHAYPDTKNYAIGFRIVRSID